MTPQKEKQPLKLIKKSPDSKKFHSTLSDKFMSLYYEHFEVAGSFSHFKHHIPSASPSRDIDSSSALRRCYVTTIEISQSVVFAWTCNTIHQSVFHSRMKNYS